MADEHVHRGDISTYRNASETFLKQRRDDLRAQIFNPSLTFGEVVQNVVGPTAVTAAALGYSLWRGVGGAIDWLIVKSGNPWFHEHLTTSKGISYMANADAYQSYLIHSSEKIAGAIAGNGVGLAEAVQTILDHTGELKHNTGRDRLQAFLDKGPEHVNSPEGLREFIELVKDIHKKSPDSHVGQFARIIEGEKPVDIHAGRAIEGLLQKFEAGQLAPHNATAAARDVFMSFRDKIIGEGHRDNERIIRRWGAPLVIGVTTAAALFTASRSLSTTRRQKVLDMESEGSFIDRTMYERRHEARVAAAEAKTDGTDPANFKDAERQDEQQQKRDDAIKGGHAQRLDSRRADSAVATASPAL